TQTGATDARAGDTASTRTDVAFDSGDAQYQTQAEVEVPDVGKITGAAGTMSFWLQPGWQEGNQDDATLMNLGDGRLQIVKNVGFLRFEFVDDAGGTGGLGTSIAEWRATSTPAPGGARPGRRRSRRPGIHAGDLLAPRPPEPRQRPLDAPLARNLVPPPPRRCP